MSNRRRVHPQPPPEVTVYADAYRCGHCTGRGALRRKPDQFGVWHINVFHDPTCRALAGTVDRTGSGLRAMTAVTEQTGTTGLYIPPQ